MRTDNLRPFALALVLVGASACPAEVQHELGQPRVMATPEVDESDPRVVKDGEDLYAAAAVARAGPTRLDHEGEKKRGSGRPDESNGVCRLYAPKLPEPQCCQTEYGFDVDTVREACGLDLYMGESFHGSCGYFFHLPDGRDVSMRTSFVPGKTAQEAATNHASLLSQKLKRSFQAEPVSGVAGAWQVDDEDAHWTFLPGWDKPRLLTWYDASCKPEGIKKVMQALIDAKQPPPGANRPGLLPTARK